jgi:CRP-like cAMP-binding protein
LEINMLTRNFLRGRRGNQIHPDERAALEASFGTPIQLPPRHQLVASGSQVGHSTMLLSGMIGRYMSDTRNRRQLVALHLPGEFVDLHGYPLQRLDHSVESLDRVTVAAIPHIRLTALIEAFPHLGRILWYSTLLDAATHRG